MTTDLESRLRSAFDADARRARVLHPDGPPVAHEVRLGAARPRRAVAVAAAVALLAGGAVGAVVLSDDGDDVTVDSASDRRPGPGATPLVADLGPGGSVQLPPAPITARDGMSAVWSGDELLVWGGADHEARLPADGAAFDPETGTWRRIPPAPDGGVAFPDIVWTGTEMVVWGGIGGSSDAGAAVQQHRGAAYDPATDTWRRIAPAPIRSSVDHTSLPVWAGEELFVFGGDGDVAEAAAYDPRADRWRRLAPLPAELLRPLWAPDPVWTGGSILIAATVVDPAVADGVVVGEVVVRYDLATDGWSVAREATYADLVGIPDGDDGSAGTVLAVPPDVGAPVDVLDRDGVVVGELPALPVDEAVFGDRIGATGTWTGDAALFEIWGDDWLRASDGTPEMWELDPDRATWLPAVAHALEVVVADDLVFTWEGGTRSQDGPLRVTAHRSDR